MIVTVQREAKTLYEFSEDALADLDKNAQKETGEKKI